MHAPEADWFGVMEQSGDNRPQILILKVAINALASMSNVEMLYFRDGNHSFYAGLDREFSAKSLNQWRSRAARPRRLSIRDWLR